jgi:alanine racemase
MTSATPIAPLPPASLQLRLDREALAANWRALADLAPGAATGAAVKAEAYGLGVDGVVPTLAAAGARHFFVAHWSEVPSVLRHVAPSSVSVLHGPVRPEDAQFARATGVRPVLNSLAQVQRWLETGGGPCDLMVNTGMNRLGLALSDLGDPAIGRLEIDTLMSHLASADEDVPLNERQLAAFETAARLVPARRRSLANSAGVALGPRFAFDLTRPGLALYGGIPRGELSSVIRQVAHPQAAVLQLRDLGSGDSVGYNATWTADRALRAATVSLGYADGFLRCWAGQGALSHHGQSLPLLGRVSMDMVVVDCSAAPDLREGDWLDVPYSLPDAAQRCGLSQYELLTLLGRRFRRHG